MNGGTAIVLAALAVPAVNGCAPSGQVESGFLQKRIAEGAVAVSEAKALKIADKIAAEKLAEYNRSRDLEARGGPFLFEDYDRKVERPKAGPRPRLSVIYVYKKPRWKGHPNHFAVWVYLDTGEAKFLGGR